MVRNDAIDVAKMGSKPSPCTFHLHHIKPFQMSTSAGTIFDFEKIPTHHQRCLEPQKLPGKCQNTAAARTPEPIVWGKRFQTVGRSHCTHWKFSSATQPLAKVWWQIVWENLYNPFKNKNAQTFLEKEHTWLNSPGRCIATYLHRAPRPEITKFRKSERFKTYKPECNIKKTNS